MRIITISREFGNGGRELGKRISYALVKPCYEQQIPLLITYIEAWYSEGGQNEA